MSTPIYAQYRARFVDALAAQLNVPAAEIAAQVKPADPQYGDFSFATPAFAKTRGVKPNELAAQLAQTVRADGLEISTKGIFVNAKLNAHPFIGEVIAAARTAGDTWGNSTAGSGKTVVIDFSSPNIAKPIAFHHVRSTAIGHAIANLYASQGWCVEGVNYLGDWGKQFGLVAVGFEDYGDPARKHEVAHLVDVYVKANERAEKEPAFDERARAFFRRMENNDEAALAFWRELRETSLIDFQKIYARLGITFQHYEGESRYQGKMDAVIDEIQKTVGTKESDGALIVDMDLTPPVLLKKSDGSTLYATRDLTAAIDRQARFDFDLSLYVVAADQSLHFKQFFAVLDRMGKPWAKSMVHVAFGRVHGMSTRKGNLKLLSEVLDEAKNRALEKVNENIADKKLETDQPELLAEQIGVGAIVFGDLKNRRTTDYEFDWDSAMALEGDTGPYLQYAHARALSVLDKGGGAPAAFDATLLNLPEELALTRELSRLPLVVSEATQLNEPSILARYLLDVAAAFSLWYTLGKQDRQKRVLLEGNEPLRHARMALVELSQKTLSRGLALLGVPTPRNM